MKKKLYDIVKDKYNSASQDYIGTIERNPEEKLLLEKIRGQQEAYFDVLLLIASGDFEL